MRTVLQFVVDKAMGGIYSAIEDERESPIQRSCKLNSLDHISSILALLATVATVATRETHHDSALLMGEKLNDTILCTT